MIYNFAEHPGGGDLVMLTILEALVEKGYSITLYTSHPQGLVKAIKTFDKNEELAEKIEVRHVETPLIRHPYNIYIIAKKIASRNPAREHDLFVVSDDIPKPLANTKVFVYVNYPHAARIVLKQLIPYKYRETVLGAIAWKIHSTLFPHYFLTNWHRENIYVAVNSTLTEHHVKEALKPINIAKVYPPVQVEKIRRFVERLGVDKEDLAVYVGRIQPEKGLEDLVKAVAMIRDTNFVVKILGFVEDRNYLRKLKKLIHRLGVSNKIDVIANATRRQVLEALAKAKTLVHPAHYEPFGIAVVEGMAAGCMPVVRKGFNGPWIDILEKGKYGHGFTTPDQLAKTLRQVLDNYNTRQSRQIIERAKTFDEKEFKNNIIKVLRDII